MLIPTPPWGCNLEVRFTIISHLSMYYQIPKICKDHHQSLFFWWGIDLTRADMLKCDFKIPRAELESLSQKPEIANWFVAGGAFVCFFAYYSFFEFFFSFIFASISSLSNSYSINLGVLGIWNFSEKNNIHQAISSTTNYVPLLGCPVESAGFIDNLI